MSTILIAHLNQVEYSTFANANPPIIAPHVGVIKLTKPLADTIVIAATFALYPRPAATGTVIGADSTANPDDDGTKNDSPTCSR